MDLISRQAAIEAVKQPHGGCYTEEAKGFAVYQLLSVPTAEPNDEEAFEAGYTKAQMELKDAYKPKKGEWVEFVHEDGELDLKCSVCGEEQGFYFAYFNFCPNCGARMEE